MQLNLTIIALIIFNSLHVFSQGAWNLKYFPTDSLDNSFIGKEIRIDLKSSSTDTLLYSKIDAFDIRWLLYRKDTVSIMIEDYPIDFIEEWRIYPDHGVLREQFLEAKEDDHN